MGSAAIAFVLDTKDYVPRSRAWSSDVIAGLGLWHHYGSEETRAGQTEALESHPSLQMPLRRLSRWTAQQGIVWMWSSKSLRIFLFRNEILWFCFFKGHLKIKESSSQALKYIKSVVHPFALLFYCNTALNFWGVRLLGPSLKYLVSFILSELAVLFWALTRSACCWQLGKNRKAIETSQM